MRPVLFRIPGLDVPIFAYGFMIMVGFLLGIFIAARRARRVGMDPNHILDLGIYLVVFGILGARVFFIIQFRDKFGFDIFNVFDGDLSPAGVIAGAGLGVLLYLCRGRLRFLKRLSGNTPNVKAFFAGVAILLALTLGRAAHVAFTPSATRIVAAVQPRADFYPESLRAELVNESDGRVWRVSGRVRLPGETFGKEKVHAYEFVPAYDRTGPNGFTLDGAREWLLQRGVVYHELRPAYDLMVFEIWRGGLVYYGGVIGAVAAAVFFAYRRKLGFWRLADLCAPGAAVGLAAGRIGCFLNGCCWGKVAQGFPFAISFPPRSPAFNQHMEAGKLTATAARSLPVYPTQLAESLAAVLMALAVWAFGRSRLKRREGEELLLLGMMYPWVRFAIEMYRGDNEPSYLFGALTVSQSVGMFVFLGCLALFVFRRIRAASSTRAGTGG